MERGTAAVGVGRCFFSGDCFLSHCKTSVGALFCGEGERFLVSWNSVTRGCPCVQPEKREVRG